VTSPTRRLDPDDPIAWDQFVAGADPGSYLQLSGWARVKAVNGWTATRVAGEVGGGRGTTIAAAQVLIRRPRPLPWGFAYAPRGPVAMAWSPETIAAFGDACR
jgi:lipid II:glycine glycyltransferase (peptidoglycan interpeptide bridge formation enzyme)